MDLDLIIGSPQESVASSYMAASMSSARSDEHIEFKTPELLEKAIDQAAGDMLYIHGVSQHDFAVLEAYREASGRRHRFKRFYPEEGLLIVTIPTHTHDLMHATLYRFITSQMGRMGLTYQWEDHAATTRRQGNGGSGEGDSSGYPVHIATRGSTVWPTLVIEAGHSQTLEGMRRDMQWWFSASNHQVKVVLPVKTDQLSHIVIIEEWQEIISSDPRRAVTRSMAQNMLRPSCVQAVEINLSRPNANPAVPASYSVTSGTLKLRFTDVFLRQPQGNEHDFEMNVDDLKWFASVIGRSML